MFLTIDFGCIPCIHIPIEHENLFILFISLQDLLHVLCTVGEEGMTLLSAFCGKSLLSPIHLHCFFLSSQCGPTANLRKLGL